MKSWLTIIALLAGSALLAAPPKQKGAAAKLKTLTFDNVVSFSSKRTFGQPSPKTVPHLFRRRMEEPRHLQLLRHPGRKLR